MAFAMLVMAFAIPVIMAFCGTVSLKEVSNFVEEILVVLVIVAIADAT